MGLGGGSASTGERCTPARIGRLAELVHGVEDGGVVVQDALGDCGVGLGGRYAAVESAAQEDTVVAGEHVDVGTDHAVVDLGLRQKKDQLAADWRKFCVAE